MINLYRIHLSDCLGMLYQCRKDAFYATYGNQKTYISKEAFVDKNTTRLSEASRHHYYIRSNTEIIGAVAILSVGNQNTSAFRFYTKNNWNHSTVSPTSLSTRMLEKRF